MIQLPMSPCKCISWQKLEGRVYIFNEKTKKIIVLNEVATIMWSNSLIFENIDEVINQVLQNFNVEKYDCTFVI